jgi:O-antigen/teichoic acid export membrane protein
MSDAWMSRRLPSEARRPLMAARLWSLAFQATSKLSLLLTLFLAASLLGVRDFGILASLQGLSYLTGFVADCGSSMLLEREVAAGRASTALLSMAVRLRLIVVVPAAILVVIATGLYTRDLGITSLATVFAIAAVAANSSALTDGLLQGQLRFRESALSQSAGRLTFLLGVAVLWVLRLHSLLAIGGMFALGEVMIAAIQSRVLVGSLQFAPADDESLPRGMRSALPYWLNSVFNLTYNRADTAIVLLLAGTVQAGLYAPASSLQTALMVVPGIAVTGLPNLGARLFSQGSHDVLRAMLRRALFGGVSLGLVCAVGMTALGSLIYGILGSSAFHASVVPAVILSWSLPFYAAEHALLGYLIAVGRPRATTWGYGAALFTALVGLVLLTPAYGAVGAAIGSMLREPVATIVLAVVAFRGRTATTRGGGGDMSALSADRPA